jgi:hypothetical protein
MGDKESPLAVDVPRAAEDRPSWVKVGVIAAVGFGIGILWPRIAGVRLGPSAPGDTPPAAGAPPIAPRGPEAPASDHAPAVLASAPGLSQEARTSASAVPSAAASAAQGPPHVVVSRGAVVACKTDDGEALKGGQACGALTGFDAIARPRIAHLRECSAADGATGKLSLVFALDFKNNHVFVDVGKSSTVPNLESIGGCVKQSFAGVSLGAMDHEHQRYTVAFNATFSAPEPGGATSTPGTPAGNVSPDAPTAAVVWEVAIVRDSPRIGQVIGRLQRGTRVRVGQGQDNWYRVRYGSAFASEGWVYRGSIGR